MLCSVILLGQDVCIYGRFKVRNGLCKSTTLAFKIVQRSRVVNKSLVIYVDIFRHRDNYIRSKTSNVSRRNEVYLACRSNGVTSPTRFRLFIVPVIQRDVVTEDNKACGVRGYRSSWFWNKIPR